MRNLLLIIVLGLLYSTAYTQNIMPSDEPFTSLDISGKFKVKLIEDSTSCSIRAIYNNIDPSRVKLTQNKNKLKIYTTSGLIENNSYIELEIRVKSLSYLKCSGVVLNSINPITTHTFVVDAQSSTNQLNLKINNTEFILSTSGNSQINVEGSAKWATLNATLKAKIDARKSPFVICFVKASGLAEVITNTSEYLDATANTKATIYYLGDAMVTKKTSTGGNIIKIPKPKY